jgi:hypothetical protein
MAMYVDDYAILDTDYLISAHTFSGDGPDDGVYYIGILLHVGEHGERVGLEYPSRQQRDTAMQALGRLLKAEHADIEALEDGD